VIGVAPPDPAGADWEHNDYLSERTVRPRGSDTTTAPKRIDLYKKNAFILEAKLSRLPGKPKAIPGQLSMLAEEPADLDKHGGGADCLTLPDIPGRDPMNATELARGFKRGGKRIESRIERALTTLIRYGRITAIDGGRYAARRAA
jgi:hypothetical protein